MPPDLTRHLIADAPLSVLLLPASDSSTCPEVVAAWLAFLESLGRPFEVIYITEPLAVTSRINAPLTPVPSPLSTGERGADPTPGETQPDPRLKVIESLDKGGRALAALLKECQYPLVFYTTCDKQFQATDLTKLLEHINEVDLVTGYRIWKPMPNWLRLANLSSRLFSGVFLGYTPEPPPDTWLGWAHWRRCWQARHLFGLRVKDPECVFRLFRRGVFQRIPLQSTSEFVHIEILAKANHLGALMAEVPVAWLPPMASVQPVAQGSDMTQLFRRPDFGPPVVTQERFGKTSGIDLAAGEGGLLESTR